MHHSMENFLLAAYMFVVSSIEMNVEDSEILGIEYVGRMKARFYFALVSNIIIVQKFKGLSYKTYRRKI